jgi:[protein-PII] uridylyltransferase
MLPRVDVREAAAGSPAEQLRDARAAAIAEFARHELREQLCKITDEWLRTQLGDERDVALVAVGGHGRRELLPGSDLDLVLAHRGRSDVKAVADRIWYPIWDAGVRLDHSVRTVAEAVSVARTDMKAVLGLLDARHVAGDEALTEDLRSRVLAEWRRDARKRLAELDAANHERAERFGELAFLLEPDLKEARGGLRDVHAMFAVAAAWIVDPPGERVRESRDVLLDVRTELHRRADKQSAQRRTTSASERLVMQEQGPIATALGYDGPDELMRDVYGAARAIAYASDDAWRRVRSALEPPRRWRSRAPTRRPLADGVVEQDGEVVLARDVSPSDDPVLQLRAPAAAAQAGLLLARHTIDRLVDQSPPLPQPWPSAALSAFIALLGSGPALVPVWESLDQAGLVTRWLPEWETVRCKPQRNAVHRFTVDRHLVETAVEAGALTRGVSRPDLLLLGALLHDIGKGFPGDHTDAGVAVVPDIAARFGLRAADVNVIVALVRNHLLLPDTATRRDLDDAATVRSVADAVSDRTTLDLLHALTVADAKATGPSAWGDWKAGLVRDLVGRTAAVIAGEQPPAPDLLDDNQRELAGRGELAMSVDGDRLTVTAPDQPGLLWRWAAVLSLHRLEIRTATATSVGPTAVTVFDVSPQFGSAPDWSLVRNDIRRAFDDPLPISGRLAEREKAYSRRPVVPVPPRVLWIDDASDVSTVVEVRAHDAIGLLHRLTKALADAELDVRSARMSTLGAEVIDAFYVVDSAGELVTDIMRRERITQALLAACQPAG